mmetsp:Transcript_2127/g.4947  ORF Transcript_2127/g.4947 Transcript_2127/m.4947 type:complete len:200 (-) Transcript_2127:778-1377(-)
MAVGRPLYRCCAAAVLRRRCSLPARDFGLLLFALDLYCPSRPAFLPRRVPPTSWPETVLLPLSSREQEQAPPPHYFPPEDPAWSLWHFLPPRRTAAPPETFSPTGSRCTAAASVPFPFGSEAPACANTQTAGTTCRTPSTCPSRASSRRLKSECPSSPPRAGAGSGARKGANSNRRERSRAKPCRLLPHLPPRRLPTVG